MSLIERGLIRLEDTVGRHLGGLWAKRKLSSITIKQILTHTSGISASFAVVGDLNPIETDVLYPSNITLGEAAARLAAYPLDYDPGSTFQYSELNFQVMGAIIEKVG